MSLNLHIFFNSLILLATLYAIVGLFIWRQRPGVAIIPFSWMMFSMSLWSLGYGMEVLSSTLREKIVWANIEMVGIASVNVLIFSFSAAYTGRKKILSARNQILLWLIPTATILLAWTNQYHHLIWTSHQIETVGGMTILASEFGVWFWLQTVYTYILLINSLGFLVLEVARSSTPFRLQAGLVLLSILFPVAGSLVYLDRNFLLGLDLMPFSFIPTVLLMTLGILRYRLLDILPMATSNILHKLQDGVLVIDARKRILYLNNKAEQLLDTRIEDAIGQPLEFIHPECGETFLRLLAKKEPYVEKDFTLHGQKHTYDIRLSLLTASEWDTESSSRGYLILFRDIHAIKQVELDLKRHEAMLSAVNLAAQQFLKTAAWEASIPAFLERLGQASEVSRAFMFQNYYGEDGGLFTSQCFEWTDSGIKSEMDNPLYRQIPIEKIGPAYWSIDLGQKKLVVVLVSQLTEADQVPFVERGVHSIAIIPIFVEERWWGFLGVEDYVKDRKWKRSELEALQAAADIFSAAETRARNEHILRRHQRTLNLLHEIVASTLQTDNLQSMAQIIVESLGRLLTADGCFLSLWDEESKLAVPLSAFGEHADPSLITVHEAEGTSLTEAVLTAGHTLVVGDVKNFSPLNKAVMDHYPYNSGLALPLIAHHKRLGAIFLTYINTRRFQHEDISIGEQAASLIALTIEKFLVMENASKRAEESETLRRAGAVVAETLRSEEAISRILEQLSYVLPHDSASVQLLRGQELEIVGGRGWDNDQLKSVIGLRFPIPGDNPNSVVIQTGKPYILDDAGKVYSEFNKEPHNHIRSWLGLPLIVHNKITGLLVVDSAKPNYFSAEHVKLASAFADQVAIALENARLFEEVQNMALTDVLTGLYNRRGLFEIGHLELSRARRLQRPFSAAMIDIDHFKWVNDMHGHPIGDQVLQVLAHLLHNSTREIDIVSRYGGEEFVILMSEADAEAAQDMAERLRVSVENTPIQTDTDWVNLTISLGVAEFDENTPDLEALIARADRALYVAKDKGRNQVVVDK